MPRARKDLVSVARTPYYHVTSRCVRRAFLCGKDQLTGKSFEHRRQWLVDRIRVLSSVFSIHICAYAVMSNHYHLVVKLDPTAADRWSDDEVLARWTALFKGPILVQQQRAGHALSAAGQETLAAITAVYRPRLGSLSWFMKCLNEPIARKANVEDRCTGHFWEARFHSQALCSDKALMAAMAYVDLNPVRARMAKTPESSDYTSIQARVLEKSKPNNLVQSVAKLLASGELRHSNIGMRPLMAFEGQGTDRSGETLPLSEFDYFELVDSTARQVARGKHGRMSSNVAPIVERLGFSAEQWSGATTQFRAHYRDGDLRLKKTV